MKFTVLLTFTLLLKIFAQTKVTTFQLANNMQVIYSKAKGKKIGLGVSVGQGVNAEPLELYGLAHLTEHSIFLGSDKYPDPISFFGLIMQNEGKFNGYTSLDGEGFYFSILASKFPEALDVFYNLINKPRFDKAMIEKEINSINSEFQRNEQCERRQRTYVEKETAAADSLLHKFTCGNNGTLRERDIANEVKKFHDENFKAENLKLAVVGNVKLKKLKKMLNSTFGTIPIRGDRINTKYGASFEMFKQGRAVILPTINVSYVKIAFLLPDQFKSRSVNYNMFIKTLLGSEGKGTVKKILLDAGLVEKLNITLKSSIGELSGLEISMRLTSEGKNHFESVLNTLYQYLSWFQKITNNSKLFNYIKQSTNWNNKKPKKLEKQLAKILHYAWKLEPNEIFKFNKVIGKYNKNKLAEYLSHFTFSNSIIYIGDSDVRFALRICENHLDKVEKWMKVKYTLCKIKTDLQHVFNKKRKFSKSTFKVRPKLPKHVKIKHNCKSKDCLKKLKTLADLKPKVLPKISNSEVLYLHDSTFLVRKTNAFLRLYFNINVNSIQDASFIRLMLKAFEVKAHDWFANEKLRHTKIKVNNNPS